MKYIIFICLIFFLNSCFIKKDYDCLTTFKLTNNSNHVIQINLFSYSQTNTLILNKSADTTFRYNERTSKEECFGSDFYDMAGDSIVICFDDSICITHAINNTCIIDNCIAKKTSFTGGKSKDYVYEYEYSFTEQDYNEALTFNN